VTRDEAKRPWLRGPGTLPAVHRLSCLTGWSTEDIYAARDRAALRLLLDATAGRMATGTERQEAGS
jgi:hypothetical protein